MPKIDPRVDEYIEESEDFARPILEHLRSLVHQACPDVSETLKWSMPAFEYKGILCGMASFKAHCAFMFWKQSLIESDAFPKEKTAMGSFGKINSLKDLPSDKVIISLIHKAMELNEKGIKVERKAKPKAEIVVPDILAGELKKNKKAAATFEKFPPSCKREYIEWITDAKTDATREKRLATTIEWLMEGKRRNWKYEKKR
ncbi:YdeI/OmpD-associated family protein [Leptolyngbya sp. 7M]|uniref:YdeI/OmpD-associated family protein n=1 Tax=Leptolyngbya sp. 7M TaxID=2812896 RepID=UPI001B8BD53A|nr:YdeI/OmpD-associated family protein [Leptolyngbya sp. 7M]QYO67941.1 YdeI/OmpD-associated family protein [Leptolyngbya sp. 7M]